MSLLGFYPLDVITKVVFGVAGFAPRGTLARPAWDIPLGVAFRIGRVRVRPRTTLRKGFLGTNLSWVF